MLWGATTPARRGALVLLGQTACPVVTPYIRSFHMYKHVIFDLDGLSLIHI